MSYIIFDDVALTDLQSIQKSHLLWQELIDDDGSVRKLYNKNSDGRSLKKLSLIMTTFYPLKIF